MAAKFLLMSELHPSWMCRRCGKAICVDSFSNRVITVENVRLAGEGEPICITLLKKDQSVQCEHKGMVQFAKAEDLQKYVYDQDYMHYSTQDCVFVGRLGIRSSFCLVGQEMGIEFPTPNNGFFKLLHTSSGILSPPVLFLEGVLKFLDNMSPKDIYDLRDSSGFVNLVVYWLLSTIDLRYGSQYFVEGVDGVLVMRTQPLLDARRGVKLIQDLNMGSVLMNDPCTEYRGLQLIVRLLKVLRTLQELIRTTTVPDYVEVSKWFMRPAAGFYYTCDSSCLICHGQVEVIKQFKFKDCVALEAFDECRT